MNRFTENTPILAKEKKRMRCKEISAGPRSALLLGLAMLLSATLNAQSDSDTIRVHPWYESISVDVFISSGYTYNFNRPDTMMNQFRVFDFDDNTFKIDVFELAFQKIVVKPTDVGFRVDMTAGSSIPRVARSAGFEVGDLDFHQVFLSYIAPLGKGVRLDFGKFITSAGYEVIEGYDAYNDNYSRSFLFGYAIPYTHTGLKASYGFNDNISAVLMIVNGWDNSTDNNSSKSVCGQVGVSPLTGMNIYATYLYGPEKTNNNSDNRSLLDVVGSYTMNTTMTIGVNADFGDERHAAAGGGNAAWTGFAGYIRANLLSKFAVSFRAEQLEDKDGVRTGVIQKLREVTVTPEYRPAEHLVLRGDIRLDSSDRNVFQKGGGWTDSQPTVSLNFIYTY